MILSILFTLMSFVAKLSNAKRELFKNVVNGYTASLYDMRQRGN